ncbi:hypothetical protein ACFQHO_53630 [Actinomadura yumaensis]|uniref:hypothetical protein n=1 Tax=Actinomadura yumaensis TaxID=111807 RepID=UPI0036234661
MASTDYVSAASSKGGKTVDHAVPIGTPAGHVPAACGVFVDHWGRSGNDTFADTLARGRRWRWRSICPACKKITKHTVPPPAAPAAAPKTAPDTNPAVAAAVADIKAQLEALPPKPDKIATVLHRTVGQIGRAHACPLANHFTPRLPDGYRIRFYGPTVTVIPRPTPGSPSSSTRRPPSRRSCGASTKAPTPG